MKRAAVLWSLFALKQAIIANHSRDAQPIILKNLLPPTRLGHTMLIHLPPLLHSLLIAPERQRQNLARCAQALKALNRDKAFDLIQHRAQMGRDIEIGLLMLRVRHHLENHCNHRKSLSSSSSEWYWRLFGAPPKEES